MRMKTTKKEIQRMAKNIYYLCDREPSCSGSQDTYYNCGTYGFNWEGAFFDRDFIIFQYNRGLPKSSKPMTYEQYKKYIESRGF